MGLSLLAQIPLQLDRKGIKEREVEEGVGGRLQLFKRGDYFKYFHKRGEIIGGTTTIPGNTVIHKRSCLVLAGAWLLVLEIEIF